MKIACTNINKNGISLNKDLIFKNIYKYNGVLGRALFRLYDLGYQSSPSVFDFVDFRQAITSDFSSELSLLRNNMSGKIELDDENLVKYAMIKTGDDSFKELLSIYLDVLVAQKALDSYNNLLSRVKVPKKSNIVNVKPRLGVSGSVHNYNTLPLDNEAIQECFILDDDETLVVFNTSDVLVKEIIKDLGYSMEDYNSHKDSGKSFFINGVSQEDELELLPIIISGKVVADGRFGAELSERIKNYYSDFYANHDSRVHCLRYEEVIFNNASDERIALNNAKRRSFVDKPFREFYVTTNSIIFAVKGETSNFSKSYFKNGKIQLGVATLSHDNRSEFSKINTLCGLCGEFIHENTIREKGWIAEGLPVQIKFGMLSGKKFRLSELSYYPIYNIYYSQSNGEKGANILPLLGNDIHIVVSNFEEISEKLGVSSKIDLFRLCLKKTDVDLPSKEINRVKYEELVADLTTALIYAECGELEYHLCGSDYTWVNDEIFYRASVEAEGLFRVLGF